MIPDREKTLANDPSFQFKRPYNWMVEQMEKRLNKKITSYPIWAWLKRPNMRTYSCSYMKEPHFVLEINIKDEEAKERLVLSDFDAWHHVLSNWYLPHKNERCFGYWGEYLQEEKEESWQNIFDIGNINDECSHNDEIQACIDNVYPKDVAGMKLVKISLKQFHQNDAKNI